MLKALFQNQLGRVRYDQWEWNIMRIAFAVVIWRSTWHTWKPWGVQIRDDYDLERANGMPSLFDLF